VCGWSGGFVVVVVVVIVFPACSTCMFPRFLPSSFTKTFYYLSSLPSLSLPLYPRAVQTLDNIAMANSEYADIVVKEGGKGAIEYLTQRHADKTDDGDDGEELSDACSSALLSMEALQRNGDVGGAIGLGSSIKRMVAINMSSMSPGASKSGASTTEAEDQKEMDRMQAKITKYRNMLVGGKVVTVQGDRGGKKKMHILCTKDLRTFMFKSPMERGNVGHTIKFDDIRRVDFGCIVKKKSKTKPGEGRFYVECVQAVRSIDIVTDTQNIADDWVDAMDALVIVSKKYRQLLPKK
jgi:hypothetical protein